MKIKTPNNEIDLDWGKKLNWVLIGQLVLAITAIRILFSSNPAGAIDMFLSWLKRQFGEIRDWWFSPPRPGVESPQQRTATGWTATRLAGQRWFINAMRVVGVFYLLFIIILIIYPFSGYFSGPGRAIFALFILVCVMIPYIIIIILNRWILRWLLYPFALTLAYLIVMAMGVVALPVEFGYLLRLAMIFGLIIWPICFSAMGKPGGTAPVKVAIILVIAMAVWMALPPIAKDATGNLYDAKSGVITRDCVMYKISGDKVVRQNMTAGTPVYFWNGDGKAEIQSVAKFLRVAPKQLKGVTLEDGTQGVVHKSNVRGSAIGRKTSYQKTSQPTGSGGGNSGSGPRQIVRETISFSTGTWSGTATSGTSSDPVQPLSGFGLPSSKTYVAVSPVGVTLQWYCDNGRGGWEYLGSYRTNSSEKPWIYADRPDQVGRTVGVKPFFGQ